MVANGKLLEYKNVFGNFYGTPIETMEGLLAQGMIAILKIDVQGAVEVMPKRPDALTVFLLPPDDGVLEQRLRDRKTDAEDVIERRLQLARDEIKIGMSKYQHQIVNAVVEDVVDQLEALTGG